ncbi:hypothetical protein Pint_06916 [Pistacia integerrima]|uniref:Uncharacterized protein n=1 Tax=Pistacia integerrima TaxID=434235 RepID=A0ACC0XWB7_9ROSI|nr:hypothetical protein Pint_06916 [Pistacia integerrima]
MIAHIPKVCIDGKLIFNSKEEEYQESKNHLTSIQDEPTGKLKSQIWSTFFNLILSWEKELSFYHSEE